MLIPVRNIEALFVFRNNPTEPVMAHPVVQKYLAGARAVQEQVHFSEASSIAWTSLERAGTSPSWPDMQIDAFPSILFIDKDTNSILTRPAERTN